MTRIGKYRQRVEIQSCAKTANGFGELEEVWTTDSTEWAQVEPLSGRQMEYAKAIVAEVSHVVRMRFTPGVAVGKRIKFNNRILNVNAVLNTEERNIELQAYCMERADQ